MKKIIMLSALALSSPFTIAQSVNSGNLDISANSISGCKVSGEDFNFGDIQYNRITDLDKSITLQCSKGTQVEITQIGIHTGTDASYTSGLGPNYLTLNGNTDASVYQSNDFLQYAVRIENQPANENYEITKYPSINRLGTHSAHSLVMKIKSGNEILLPVRARMVNFSYGKKAGDYSDTMTYTLSY